MQGSLFLLAVQGACFAGDLWWKRLARPSQKLEGSLAEAPGTKALTALGSRWVHSTELGRGPISPLLNGIWCILKAWGWARGTPAQGTGELGQDWRSKGLRREFFCFARPWISSYNWRLGGPVRRNDFPNVIASKCLSWVTNPGLDSSYLCILYDTRVLHTDSKYEPSQEVGQELTVQKGLRKEKPQIQRQWILTPIFHSCC